MVNVNGELGINGDKWMMEKIRSSPCTITGPLYLTTFASPHSSCTLSHFKPWNSHVIPTFHSHHPHWRPSWYPSCISPELYCFLSHTSCTSRPPLGPPMEATSETVCFHCHALRHLCVDCPEYECPNCHQHAPGHPQYHCLQNYCSFCQCFSHTPCYCPDHCCALCDDPGHIIADCPFSEDPSSRVIFNNRDPKGIWHCPSGTTLQRGYCYSMRTELHLLHCTFGPIISWLAAHIHHLRYLFYRHLPIHCLVTFSFLCM